MVSHLHDFTDSESEEDRNGRSEAPARASASASAVRQEYEHDSDSGSESEVLVAEQSENLAGKSNTGIGTSTSTSAQHPLRITLRPNLNHLINQDSPATQPTTRSPKKKKTKSRTSAYAPASASEPDNRSSLSPPPPITLKLGSMNRIRPQVQALAEKATYSSSEEDPDPDQDQLVHGGQEEEEDDYDDDTSVLLPRLKKARKPTNSNVTQPYFRSNTGGAGAGAGAGGKKKTKLQKTSSNSSAAQAHAQAQASLPAQHRKSYDWLQPSTASASHHGPPEREREREAGWSAAEEAIGGLLDLPDKNDRDKIRKDKDKDRSHKKRAADAPVGPGKSGKKGQKKGPAYQLKAEEGDSSFGGDVRMSMSREGSPESTHMQRTFSDQGSTTTNLPPPSFPRAPSPPFILADAAQLGFPVFSKPIVAPKIGLGPFPKVTQYFAPANGGDVGPFPRKEPVRNWTHGEKIFVGIGGGQLKINPWIRGPASELGKMVQADKEAREASRQAKIRATAALNAANASAQALAESTQGHQSTAPENIGGNNNLSPSPNLGPTRPGLVSAISYEGSVSVSVGGDDISMSEVGDEDNTSVTGSVTPIAVGKPKSKTTTKPKSKIKTSSGGIGTGPRKSKLAQEIVIVADDDNDDDNDNEQVDQLNSDG